MKDKNFAFLDIIYFAFSYIIKFTLKIYQKENLILSVVYQNLSYQKGNNRIINFKIKNPSGGCENEPRKISSSTSNIPSCST